MQALIVTTDTLELQDDHIERRLAEMRWLKNKVFFGSVTGKAVESFR
jgi:hypothetical protein